MFYIKFWFYTLALMDWRPFPDPLTCQEMARYHAEQTQDVASPCFQGYEERALVQRLLEGGQG